MSIFCDLVDLPEKMGERNSALALGGALVLVLVTAAQGGMPVMGVKDSVVVRAAYGGFGPTPDDRAVVRAAGSSILPTSARILAPPRAGLFMTRGDCRAGASKMPRTDSVTMPNRVAAITLRRGSQH